MSFGSVFHFDFSQGDAFMKSLGRLFCVICTVCTLYPFIYLLSSRDACYKSHFIVKMAVTGIKTIVQKIYVLSFGPFWNLLACVFSEAGKVENNTNYANIAKYGPTTLAGDQPGCSLFDSALCLLKY